MRALCTCSRARASLGVCARAWGASLTFLVAEVIVRHVVSSAAAAAARHLCLAVALIARESVIAVRVFIAIALTFATHLARRAPGTALVDESVCCVWTVITRLSVSYKMSILDKLLTLLGIKF